MSSGTEIQLIAIIISIACALPGAFLVLRKLSMMVESITHTVLLGIVLVFFITHDLHSPFLIMGAALVGILTTWLTELLVKTRLLSKDASTGMIFTLLFSIAIILLSRYASKIHFCEDTVLMGELAFTPFDRLTLWGMDMGPVTLSIAAGLLLFNVSIITLFFKELKLASFDPKLAAAIGFSPMLIHYMLMTLVSVTAVGSFQSIGSILVVAFMIAPPATAYLLCDDLKHMLIISSLIATANSILGYHLALVLNSSISGSMASVTGLSFLLVFIFAPHRGLIHALCHRKRKKLNFAKSTLLFYLCHHGEQSHSVPTITHKLQWEQSFANKVLAMLQKEHKIKLSANSITLTPRGRQQGKEDYQAIFESSI